MRKLKNIKSGLIMLLLMFVSVFSATAIKTPNLRVISIAGLVVNAQTLSPIQSAKLYDSAEHLLGQTDKNGYFNIVINYVKTGAINFKLKIIKQNYYVFLQHENWADIHANTKNIMYFGLQENSDNKAKLFSSFSNTSLNSSDLSFQNVYGNFSKVREQREFDNKLEKAKVDNENVYLEVESNYYIVDQNGWIKISSGNDLISVDKKHIVKANQLNSFIKRKNVKGMTPLDSDEAKFEIRTR